MAESEGTGGGVGEGAEGGGGGGGVGVGGGGGAARAMMGGSLPPRKRLLADLKQNGWLAASSGAQPSPGSAMVGLMSSEGGGRGAMAEGGGGRGEGGMGGGEAKEGCMSCGVLESSAWRRVKRNGVVQRLCNSCALMFNKNMNCPHCLAVYPDVKDPSVWLQCCRCQRSVHVECEKKSTGSTQFDSASYVCPDCVLVKKHKELANGVVGGTRVKGCGGRVGVNCSVDAGNCASSAAAECSSPSSKKPRVSREPRSKAGDSEIGDVGKAERICSDAKAGLGRKGVSSQEAAAAAAAATAAMASRAAAAAKATAAAKAAAAVKAAAVAKAALDAAAYAARAEAQARAELRRNSGSSETTISKHDAHRRDKNEKPEVKLEGEVIQDGLPSNIDDEELARQLHRAINSSPRISRSLTPLRRKPVVPAGAQPGTVASAADSVRAWPRTAGLSPPSENRPQAANKQQQTRPRSVIPHKEVKRLDPRVVKSTDADSFSAHVLKSEPVDSTAVPLAHAPQDFTGAQLHDCMLGGGPDVYSGSDGNHRLSDAEVSQAAAMLDEVLMSEEAEAAEAAAEGARLGDVGGELYQETYSVTASLTAEGVVSRVKARELDTNCSDWQMNENDGTSNAQEGLEVADVQRDGYAALSSDVPGLPQAIGGEVENVEVPDASAGGDAVLMEEGQWSIDDGGNCTQNPVAAQENFGGEMQQQQPTRPSEESPSKEGNGTSELEGSPSQVSATKNQSWHHQGILKGMPPVGGQSFASGVHMSPFPSAAPLPIRTPAVGSGRTTRHS